MESRKRAKARRGGPFRLFKYFIIPGCVVIFAVTFLLAAFLYSRSVNTLLKSAESYGRLLAENLNYNIFVGFYGPLKARGVPMDLKKWDQFGALDSLIKDFTYGLKIPRIKVMDRQHKIVYSTNYDLIGRYESQSPLVENAVNGEDRTVIRKEHGPSGKWHSTWLADTYYPLREGAGNYWMLGNIWGVIQITQDVTDQYVAVQRSIMVIISVAVGLMAFLFVMLAFIVRRGERILLERAEEQKKLEDQLRQSEKLASLGQMVATIAHEIRNPLGIIRSSAEVLSKKSNPDPARIRKLSGVIVEEATRLSNILKDFLDFARPKLPRLTCVDVREVLRRVKNNMEQETQRREIRWMEVPSNGDAPLVMGDSDLLYQAFLNMAINAFDAMKAGGTLTVGAIREDADVRVDFADDGQGISEENLHKIFTPFFTTQEMGTGLGLSVVHNIITAHKGEVTVRSKAGEGTVFTVRLPRGDRSAAGSE